jgi:hypothetical protein
MLAILKCNKTYDHLYTSVLLTVYTNHHHISSCDEVTNLLIMSMICCSCKFYIYIYLFILVLLLLLLQLSCPFILG